MHRFFMSLLVMLFVVGGSQSALGYMQFYKEWVKMYVDEEDESEENQEYIELVVKDKKNRCLICHQGKKKKHHNAYGNHFLGKLTKDDKKDEEKIIEVLKEVGEMPVDPEADPEDEDTITYDDLIARKELPGGDLEDLQEEPEEEEKSEDGKE